MIDNFYKVINSFKNMFISYFTYIVTSDMCLYCMFFDGFSSFFFDFKAFPSIYHDIADAYLLLNSVYLLKHLFRSQLEYHDK